MLTHHDRTISRLEALSDGVFAFAATLLVVSLEVPRTFPALVADLQGFVAFGVCFAALILIWSVHNAFFRRFGIHDRTAVFLNSCLLFVVLFYVYPLKFLVESLIGSVFGLGTVAGITNVDELSVLFMLYSAGFVAIFGIVAAMYRHAHRSGGRMNLSASERQEATFYFRHYSIFDAVGMLSIVLAWLKVGIGFGAPGLVFVLLGPLCYLHGVRAEKRAKAGDA